ncbi:hypothetical protein PF010_g23064 [Phytophthora fragariae]|uniref:Dynein axonemal assembly factor 11-like CS domain-containing protein n=2 Tax=Phytophthora TaxID=4783 RepID=A0A6A3IID6_9STRA|nr:hypothetical protein PR001_g30532 [Phytophthora rubi]KAE8980315.1 hypothetical protein PF011_g22488 [Phytophthora fragariae]KAE9078627.1 hypothetical protein PF010_g23064 [Phytophthora fragariae]KAE9188181.1 hypothetical protein PF004_g22579 [Phytophthora fragariae]KAE9269482.1 hypothetical protein PR003_g31136 [Phytophthora rubi]
MFVRSEAKKVRAKKELERKEEDGVIEVVGGEATDISEDQVEKKKSVMASTEKVPYTPRRTRDARCIWRLPSRRRRGRRDDVRTSRKSETRRLSTGRRRGRPECKRSKRTEPFASATKEFRLMDEILDVILEVDLPRFLDSSLVDVDVHPSYVSIVAKNKVLRLKFPELVHSDAGMAERSKITRTLRLTLPKAHVTPTQQLRAQLYRGEQDNKLEKDRSTKR